MPQHLIVGVCGPKFSGKDTSAAVLVRNHQFLLCSFASFLKEACRSIFMLSHDQLHGDKKETVDPRWNVTPREILQKVGTDLFRDRLSEVLPTLNLGEDKTLWSHCMRLWLDAFATPQRIVIPDVRFKDEEDFIRSLGGKIVRITRDTAASSGDLHVSELEQAKIEADFTVSNNGTIHDLEVAMTRQVVASLLPGAFNHMPIRGLRLDHIPESAHDLEMGVLITLSPKEGKKKKRQREETVPEEPECLE